MQKGAGMNKWKLLPHLAVKGIVQNGRIYGPYIITCVFSAVTFFIFSSILHNDLSKSLPRSAYAWLMLMIGQILLGLILIPFLFYANSFLIKRRTREIGLYSILGLEKKHIGIMLVCETLILYMLAAAGGILFGGVLSKLLFLLLLKMSGLPVKAEFVFTWQAVKETAAFFMAVFAINLFYGLIQVGKSRPVELFSGSKKGEKEPKWTGVWGISGVLILGLGYATSIQSEVDSQIFTDFFLSVFEVVLGTYLLFTSGSILLLKKLKGNKKFYYRSENFITVSGMLYRMKKNAAGLSNICIFSTMVIITLVCTVSLYAGFDGIARFKAPYDLRVVCTQGNPDRELLEAEMSELEERYGIRALRADSIDSMSFGCGRQENSFLPREEVSRFEDVYDVRFVTLEDYNRVEKENKELEENQVLFYSTGKDFGYNSVVFMGEQVQIKEELTDFFPWPKSGRTDFGEEYVLVVKDEGQFERYAKAFAEKGGIREPADLEESRRQTVGVLLEGEDELKQDFIAELSVWVQGQEGFLALFNGMDSRAEIETMYGGLLFIGIIFGIVFFMCLLLIMYYKQITEGYEDQGSFAIMQKVGMSDKEIKSTVRRQIFLVFFLPLLGALLHTFAGMFMVEALMGVLGLFDDRLIAGCCAGIALLFILIYGVSYAVTAKTYYRIVS